MPFPSDALRARGGEIYGWLFENPTTGVRLDVYWGVRVDFEPFSHLDETVECSAAVEWIRWGHRSWRELGGSRLEDHHRDMAEASFYVWQHDWAEVERLEVRDGPDGRFELDLEMLVDFAGFTGNGDEQRDMPVTAAAQVSFEGIYAGGDGRSEADVIELARPFLQIEDFSVRRRESGGFLFAPRFDTA